MKGNGEIKRKSLHHLAMNNAINHHYNTNNNNPHPNNNDNSNDNHNHASLIQKRNSTHSPLRIWTRIEVGFALDGAQV